MKKSPRRLINLLQEFSIPLVMGMVAALVLANLSPSWYHSLVAEPLLPMVGSTLTFLVNEIFMALFFGLAAKEITEALLADGSLHPLRKALNPLCGTLGGVLGPLLVFFLLTHLWGQEHLSRGWGIPTATDIALAWVGARIIFGEQHPAIDYLLLLAIVDDGIGLGIIALFYGDPLHPLQWPYLSLVGAAMFAAWMMRVNKVYWWPLYIFGPGLCSWLGLYYAHLHPALALVFIVPFLPSGSRDRGLFVEEQGAAGEELANRADWQMAQGSLQRFSHQIKLLVDFGLFFFAFANSGVQLSATSEISYIVVLSLVVGKSCGITLCSLLAVKLGLPLPEGMNSRQLVVVAILAGMGLTVALFVGAAAYTHELAYAQGPAKMGALLSVVALPLAWGFARLLGVRRK